MIVIENLSKSYQMGQETVHALQGINLTINAGEFVAIMGPSGSGKSTLMNILGILDGPDSGTYALAGKDVSHLKEDQRSEVRSKTIGFIFQQFNLLPRTSALENVALPLLYSDTPNQNLDLPQKLLHDVGLGSRMGHKPNELSGGQQQRVAIARALVNSPPVILADEPTGNLDSKSQEDIMALLKDLNAQGKTVIIITHEEEVAEHAKRIIRMRDGKILSDTEQSSNTHPRPLAENYPVSSAATPSEKGNKTALTSPSFEERGGRGVSVIFQWSLSSHFRQAFRALNANKVRTFLSMLGILIGVTAVIAMLALGQGAQQDIKKRLESLGSNLLVLRPGNVRTAGVSLDAGSVTRLTQDDGKALAELDHINRVAPSVSGRARAEYAGANWSTQVYGTVPDYAAMRASEPAYGRFFTEADDKNREKVAVIGATVVRELFKDGQNPIGETLKLNKIRFRIIGVLPEKGSSGFRDQDDIIIIPLGTAMHRVLGKNYVDSIDIEVDDPANMEAAQDAIDTLMSQRHRIPSTQEGFQIRNMADIQKTVSQTSETMSFLLSAIALISLGVGGIGIMNIMLVSVTERTREIGLRKAVGAKYMDIMLQFLIEAMVVSIGGGVLGIALGWVIALGMSQLAHWTVVFSPTAALVAFLFSGGVGIAFGLWPAKKAASLHPIDALRYE
jgi:macrolide transport system ATP-binding/permease protein